MARLLFVSDVFLNESLGIMYLSAYLKANGHQVDLTLMQDHKDEDSLVRHVEAFAPDLIGFSVMTPQVSAFRPVTRILKERTGRKIVWGGAHCMFMQDDVMTYPGVDYICLGDGEEALLELMNRIESGADLTDVPSMYIRTDDGAWHKNPLAAISNDLDTYPFPDRGLYYDKYPLLARFAVKRLITARGCPFKCAYCFEPTYFEMYKGKNKVIRRHSPDYVIEEVRRILERYPTRRIHFNDDIFNLNRPWVKEFCAKYKAAFPTVDFSCNIELSSIDEDTIETLVKGGCRGGTFGLEAGSERIRLQILNKKVTDARYEEACALLRKHKFQYFLNVMFCHPTESFEEAVDSMRFAVKLKPRGIRVAILKMYKGTRLADFAIANGLSEGVGEFTYKARDVHGAFGKIRHMTWASVVFLKMPFLMRFAGTLMTDAVARVLAPVHLLVHWEDIRFFDIPLWQAWQYFWSSRDVFIGGMAKAQDDTYAPQLAPAADLKKAS